MILIFDFFETLVNNISLDFNRGLKWMWEKHYADKCSFDEIKVYGEELFQHLLTLHKEEKEFAFVKEELPFYAEKFGGDVIPMTVEEEAHFLMLCNEMELVPGLEKLLLEMEKRGNPMYILSNSGFSGAALTEVLKYFGLDRYFRRLFSSADFGRIKPSRELFDMAINTALSDCPHEEKKDIIYVGDTYETDVKGAYGAGIKACWINRKHEEDLEGIVSYEISETEQLINIL